MSNKTLIHFRISPEILAAIAALQHSEQQKLMSPVSRADILRKCISLGLKVWENSEAKQS